MAYRRSLGGVMMERTSEEMRDYLDHPPDADSAVSFNELSHWPETDQAQMTEESKQAYIDEHHETCAWCGETREWHNLNPVRDHLFDPNERVPIEG